MANQDHVQLFAQGVTDWNRRREENPFQPDLSGERLGGQPLGDPTAPATFARCSGVDLHLADLRGTDLGLTDLTGADLSYANLEGASLMGADLTGASLLGARVKNANLRAANLSYANLEHADFTEAHLEDAALSRVSTLPASIWNAKLYPPSEFSSQPSIEVTRIDSVNCLLENVGRIRAALGESARLFFRGESQCGWELRPSLMRRPDLIELEHEMLADLMTRRPGEFSNASTALDQWVLAQHHGLKTRFLDITKNPLVALFHACEQDLDVEGRLHVFGASRSLIKRFNSDTLSIVANYCSLENTEKSTIIRKDDPSLHHGEWPPRRVWCRLYSPGNAERRTYARVLVHKIQERRPEFQERVDPRDLYRVFVVEPLQFAERIRVQSGAFLVSGFHERLERTEILKWNADIPVYSHYELLISSRGKECILKDLGLLNLTRETLFPGLDASAAAVTQEYSR